MGFIAPPKMDAIHQGPNGVMCFKGLEVTYNRTSLYLSLIVSFDVLHMIFLWHSNHPWHMLLAYIGVPHGAKWSLVITTFAVILTQYIHVVLMKQLCPFSVLIFFT